MRARCTLCLALILPSLAAASTARGVVFVDENGDGTMQHAESPLAGVAVSNGSETTQTDEAGRFTLEWGEDGIVFVVKPRGYRAAYDAMGRSAFHRDRSRLSAASAPLVFALEAAPEPDAFSALLLADPQTRTEEELDFLREDVLAELPRGRALFGATLGDLVFDRLDLLPRYASLVGALGMPWYQVPGNHELDFESADDQGSLATFRSLFGPSHYAFDVGPAHFVVLDTVHYKGRASARESRPQGEYEGRLGERQLRWLRGDLALVPRARLVVLLMHIPLKSDIHPDAPQLRVADRDALVSLLEGRPHVLALAGHTHMAEHHYVERGGGDGMLHLHTLATASGSWWSGPTDTRGIPDTVQRDGTPNGWSMLHVDGTRARVTYHAAGAPNAPPLRACLAARTESSCRARCRELLGAARLEPGDLSGTDLVVNLFDGGPRSRVELSIDGGGFIEAQHARGVDPHVAGLFSTSKSSFKRGVSPLPSTHLWRLPLPGALAPGVHRVKVRARDEYGSAHELNWYFEVEPARE